MIIEEIGEAVSRKKRALGGLSTSTTASLNDDEGTTREAQHTAEKLAKKANRPMILIGG